ncbi:MAG: hypothetical protein V8Q32_00165 [Anaerotignum faecicola]
MDDIISELEVQVAPLEKQSEKAREYLRLKERLKQAEMTAFCRDAARIAKETEMLLQAEQTAAEQLAQSLAESDREKTQAASFREKNEELDALLQQQNEKMTGCARSWKRQRARFACVRSSVPMTRQTAAVLPEKWRKRRKSRRKMKRSRSFAAAKMAGLKLEMDARQEELDALQEEYASLSTVLSQDETKVESFKDEIFEQIRIGTEAKGKSAKREAMQEQFLARKAQLLGEKEHTESRLHQFAVHLQALEKQENDRKEQIRYLEQELTALEQDKRHAIRKSRRQRQAFPYRKDAALSCNRVNIAF